MNEKNRFNTFGGVFTPSILTILGVIMFMRANFVVGQAGIIGAVAILLVAKGITLTTSFSIAAVSTNMRVKGGGSYYLISRVLGPEFGGAIGIALFFALSLSVPFYILGFTEALVLSLPSLAPHFQKITLLTATFLFVVAFSGAGWAIRVQYLIMLFLFLAIVAFLGGAVLRFSPETFMGNLLPSYTFLHPGATDGARYSFWLVFAIYFPAVTGIDAGLNMSGDLKDPGRSIPKGTMAAVAVGFIVYLLQIILDGGAYPRGALLTAPYTLLRDHALFGLGHVVTLGMVAATISSALGSYLGAPRVLQAVGRDRVLEILRPFGRGSGAAGEPRRALFVTMILTMAVLLLVKNASGGRALNAVAAIITMFFLYSYGMINLAAFLEDFSDNPSFRPRFHLFHWSVALVGALGCLAAAILVNWIAALISVVIIGLFLWHLKTKQLRSTFGDVRRGFVFSTLRNKLLALRAMEEDPKNWRPTILAFSGNPREREDLVMFSTWLEARRGLVFLAHVIAGEFSELAPMRQKALAQLNRFCNERELEAFPLVAVAETVNKGISLLMQGASVGPIRPNVAVFGMPSEVDPKTFSQRLHTAVSLEMNVLVLDVDKALDMAGEKRIDIWWRGKKNGGLLLLFAYLLATNWEWEESRIRVLRVVEREEGREQATTALEGLIRDARVEAEARVVVSNDVFDVLLPEYSGDASCVFLGFEPPEQGQEAVWLERYQKLTAALPVTVMVNSRGEEGLLA